MSHFENKEIKVFCVRCTEHVLDTSDKFQCGGPYSGEMFVPVGDNWFGDYFNFERWVEGGNLHCPRCHGNFIDDDGALLTEYGRVKEGQATIDRSTTLAHDIGNEKDILSRDDVWAPEMKEPEPEPEPVVEKPPEVSELEPPPDGQPEQPKKRKFICKKCGKEIPYGMAHKGGCE